MQAVHSGGIAPVFVDAPGEALGLTGYGGSEGGFVLTFTNGLVVYLTGDTGMFGDMNTIIGRFHTPTVVVLNMADTATLGPNEAVFTIKELVRPRTVLLTHTNEQSTSGGVTRTGTRADLFSQFVRDHVDVVMAERRHAYLRRRGPLRRLQVRLGRARVTPSAAR